MLVYACRMKRISLLILGYFLILQAALGVFMCCGQPENAAIILTGAGLSGWGGYALIKKAGQLARVPMENAPTKDLVVPETKKLDRK